MASCYSTRWQRFCHKCFPFLYKKCPEGNYHSVFDRLCYCRLQQYSNEWNGGILDLKTGKEYIPAFQYTQIVNKYNRLCEAAQREQGFGTEDEEPIPYRVVGKYEALGESIGALVDRKNKQYGDAFNRGGCILEILYPDGVRPDQYRDMLGVIRVIDKLFRVANGKQGNEDPWQDIAGYGLLGAGE